MQAVIQECKAFKPLAAKQNANLVNGFYYTVEDSQPTKNADGQWTAKRSITKKPRTTALETNIRKTLELRKYKNVLRYAFNSVGFYTPRP